MSWATSAAFTNYLTMLIFPILVIGFMSNVIAMAQASLCQDRAPCWTPLIRWSRARSRSWTADRTEGHSVAFRDKAALKEISFRVDAGSKTAVIGPTAAGKTQLLYLLTGLNSRRRQIEFDGQTIEDYKKKTSTGRWVLFSRTASFSI